jgi:enediyne biosynthesis protein E4
MVAKEPKKQTRRRLAAFVALICAAGLAVVLLVPHGVDESHSGRPKADAPPRREPPNTEQVWRWLVQAEERFKNRQMDSTTTDIEGGTRPAFSEVGVEAGLDYQQVAPGAESLWYPEMKGTGLLLADFDGDGWLDILFGAFSPSSMFGEGPPVGPRLFKNLGGMRFEEATAGSGLPADMHVTAGAAGDVDRDGDTDLVLSTQRGSLLYLNRGSGSFEDSRNLEAGEADGLKTTAAMLDFDLDGHLDVLTLGYVNWSPQLQIDVVGCNRDKPGGKPRVETPPPPPWPLPDGGEAEKAKGQIMSPACFPPGRSRLYRGLGGGRFSEVSDAAGLGRKGTNGLGLSILDLEGDSYPDIIIANDMIPTNVYRNRRDGTFEEQGLKSGMAFARNGRVRAGMGIDAAYLFGDDRLCLGMGFFYMQESSLYCQRKGGGGAAAAARFEDLAPSLGVGAETVHQVTFGVLFSDYDSDGWRDLLMANGHVSRHWSWHPEVKIDYEVQQAMSVYQNLGGGRLAEWILPKSDPLGEPTIGRALADGDLDHDGDVDLVLTQIGGPALLYRNDTSREGRHAIILELRGTGSNVAGLGSHVHVRCGGAKQHRYSSARPSFMGQSSTALHFGLGACEGPVDVEVRWPGRARERFPGLAVDQAVRLTEGAAEPHVLYTF